jgi:hypothetical protein
LLIDDARCYVGKGDYPTIDQLTNYVKSKNENYRVEVKYDIASGLIGGLIGLSFGGKMVAIFLCAFTAD